MEAGLLGKVSELTEELYTKSAALDEAVAAVPTDDNEKAAHHYHDVVISAMDEVRAPAESWRVWVGKKFRLFPTHSDILFLRFNESRHQLHLVRKYISIHNGVYFHRSFGVVEIYAIPISKGLLKNGYHGTCLRRWT